FVWGRLLEKCPAWARHVYTLLLVTAGWVLFRAPTLAQAGSMLAAMFGFAPAGAGSGEALYYLKEFRWEWIFSILAATPIKVVLERRLAAAEEAGSRASALVSSLGVKLLASALLGFSCVRLLSSTFRSFLYFQF
ncbi:MAG: MBOAT family protein, partial [Oscillibacter sp.]|nr:MBOAT family protein [Oscillibacter sp.]